MEETQIYLDDEAFVPLSDSMQRQLNKLCGNTNNANNFTIFRTPQNISSSMKNLLHPSVISIGPFHNGRQHLRALEEQKWRVLENFLSRGDVSLDLCISEMKLLEQRTRMCYSETIDLDSDAFVKMMLLDGCFVVEYFLQLYGPKLNIIIDVGSSSSLVNFNLLLLENQIPFFIVEKLCDLIGFNEDDRMSIVNGIVYFVTRGLTIQSNYFEIPYEPPAEIHHLVHLFYHYLVPNIEKPLVLSSKSFDLTKMFYPNRIKRLLLWFLSWVLPRKFPLSTSQGLSAISRDFSWKKSSFVIPSATELTTKGLKLKKKSYATHMLDISFEYGVLKIPTIAISAATKPLFTNLIAFENSNHGKEYLPFTSFVTFLDNLINTPNDVVILQKCGIIENWLGSEEELTYFINQVTEIGSVGENHYLAVLFMEVNKYIESHWIKSSWKRQQAKLIHEYFSSPWKAISLFAALILLVLTCVQTFYAVYAYKFPPSS